MREGHALLALAEEAVSRALKVGADQAEAYVVEGRTLKLQAHGDYAASEESHSLGVAVRVAVGRRLGLAGSTGIHLTDRLIDDALKRARGSPEHKGFEAFPAPARNPLAPTEPHEAMREPDPVRLESLAREAHEGMASPLTDFSSVGWACGSRRFAVANSQGLAAWDQTGKETLDLEARIRGGERSIAVLDVVSSPVPLEDRLDPRTFAAEMVERGRRALEPAALERPVDALVLAAVPAGQLVLKLLQGLSGNVVQGGHAAHEELGAQIASPWLTVRDLPNGPGVVQRQRMDHEGVPTGPLDVIDRGILVNHFHDSISGTTAGTGSNGRGLRRSGSLGGVGSGALHPVLAPGRGSLDDLVAGAERAVLVTDPFTGMFTANATTGDFSLVAPYSFLVEGGEVVTPLAHTTIGGNIHRALKTVEQVGAEPHEHPMGTFVPLYITGGVSCAT